jgi:hypothetical protein
MLATVVALYNAERDSPLSRPWGRRTEEVLRKRVSVLVAAAMILVTMLAAASRVFANQGGTPPPLQQGEGAA